MARRGRSDIRRPRSGHSLPAFTPPSIENGKLDAGARIEAAGTTNRNGAAVFHLGARLKDAGTTNRTGGAKLDAGLRVKAAAKTARNGAGRVGVGERIKGAGVGTHPGPHSSLPDVQYLVAFNNSATDDPALITTVASPPGTLGGVNVWTDITQYVAGHHLSRGRQHELGRFETGSIELTLNNNGAVFNPWNTAGPYTGKLLPMKPIQYRAKWNSHTYTRFTGYVEAWPIHWPDPLSAWATVQAVDAFGVFNMSNVTGAAYVAQVLADGAQGYWRLGERGNTTTAKDSSPSGFDGAYTGAPTQGVAGASLTDTDGAVSFGATVPSGAVKLPGAAGNFGTGDFTLELWLNTTTALQSVLIDLNSPTYNGVTDTLFLLALAGGGSAGQVYSFTTSSNLFGPLVNDGKWHQIVITRTTPAGSQVRSLYLDGVLVASVTDGSITNLSGSGSFIAGYGRVDVVGTFGPFGLAGSMDEVSFYPSALTPTQIANHFVLGSGGFLRGSTGQRISDLLDTIGWPSGARNLDGGSSTVQANTQNLSTTKALSALQVVEQTEDGALFMAGDGKVRFIQRMNILTSTVTATNQATFGDTIGTEIPFEPNPDLALDSVDIWNEAVITRQGGVALQFEDAASVAAYGRRTYSAGGQLHETDAVSLYHAQWIVSRLKSPLTRLRALRVNLLGILSNVAQTDTVLALDLLYRVTANRHGVPGGGTAFTQVALIERIEETVTPDSWELVFELSPTDAQNNYWTLDTSALDAGTILAR